MRLAAQLFVLLATHAVVASVRADEERTTLSWEDAVAEASELDSEMEETEETPRLGARARVRLEAASRNSLDATAAGTAIEIEGRPQAFETLRDVLVEAPGARVLSTGAIGQFNTISLRGTELGQTSVMLDDLPLGGADVGPVDLSLLPISAFKSVEVYRGGAPAWIGDGAIGGVVRLVPRTAGASSMRAIAEAGSFGTYRGGLEANVQDGPFSLVMSASVLTSRQDFRFRNENGTLFDRSDDVIERQRNAEITQRHLFFSARYEHRGSRVDLVYLGLGRDGGFPGAGLRRTDSAQQATLQNIASASYTFVHRLSDERRFRIQARLGANTSNREFQDLLGGVGLSPTDSDDRVRVISGRIAASIDVTRWLEASLIGSARQDNMLFRDRLSTRVLPPAERAVYSATAELRAHRRFARTDYELRASILAQRNALASRVPAEFGTTEEIRDSRTLLTGRVAFSIAPREWLNLQGSFHSGARAPSVLELFGNRTTIVGNPRLRPEGGLGGDLGATLRFTLGDVCVLGEARAYVQAMDDVIIIVPTSQFQARASNLPRALVVGFESSARIAFGEHLDTVFQWNATSTRDTDGYRLPNRPAHNAYARVTGSLGRRSSLLSNVRAYVDVTTISRTFLAEKELASMPARTFFGAGVELALLENTLHASVSVRDLTNVGGTDFLGYPLSRRSFGGALSYRKEFP